MVSVQARRHDIPGLAQMDIPGFPNIQSLSYLASISGAAERIPAWSIYPAERDAKLREFWKTESIFAGAVYSIVAKMKSLPRKWEGPSRSVKAIEDLFSQADFGNGHMTLVAKTVQDLLTQDNGFFWELVGKGSPNGPLLGPPTEVNYLDPARCYRTFDPTYPVLYVDPINGKRHRLHHTRVIMGSSMPQPDELSRGVGFSALSRVLERVRLVRAILQHRLEVATGTQRKAIIHGRGVSARTLIRALRRADTQTEQEELYEYQSMPVLTTAQGVDLNVLSLAGIPDGYSMVDEHTIYVYIIALVLGVDAREIWPATVTGASKADASVQHMKARGKGFADILTELERAHNLVAKRFSPALHVVHDFVDDEQDQMTGAIQKQRTEILSEYKKAGAIDAKEMRALAISEGILNSEVLDNVDTLEGMQNFDETEDSVSAESPEDASPQEMVPEEPDPSGSVDEGSAFLSYFEQKYLLRRHKSIRYYREALRRISRAVWDDRISYLEFLEKAEAYVQQFLNEAMIQALYEVGLTVAELTVDERILLAARIAEEISYLQPFARWLLENQRGVTKLVTVFNRVELWVNSFNKMKNYVKTAIGGDVKLLWVMDPAKEHCRDCARLDGRVYRAKIWARYGIKPQDARLACSGYRCGCLLLPTDRPANTGFPPSLR